MKTTIKMLILCALVGAFQTGCVGDPVTFRKCDMTNAKVLGESEGNSTGIMLFNVIPITQNQRFKNAYDDAIAKLGGTCLNDPEIRERWFWAWVLNGYSFNVKGTVVKEMK